MLPAHPTLRMLVLAPESPLFAKSHRQGRFQFRHWQLTEAQPSQRSPVLVVGVVVDDAVAVDGLLETMTTSWPPGISEGWKNDDVLETGVTNL